MISCDYESSSAPKTATALGAYLKRLRIPVLHLLYRRHLIEPIGKLTQLLHAVGKTDGELFREELRRTEEGP